MTEQGVCIVGHERKCADLALVGAEVMMFPPTATCICVERQRRSAGLYYLTL